MGLLYVGGAALVALAIGLRAAVILPSRITWGVQRRSVVAKGAPFRSAVLHEEIGRSAPLRVRAVLFAASVLGVFTLAFFAPAGLFLMMLPPAGAVAVSGFPAGVHLVRTARRAARREPTSRKVLRYLMGHHVAVIVVLGLGSLLFDGAWPIGAFSAGMGLLGCLLIAALARIGGVEEEPESH